MVAPVNRDDVAKETDEAPIDLFVVSIEATPSVLALIYLGNAYKYFASIWFFAFVGMTAIDAPLDFWLQGKQAPALSYLPGLVLLALLYVNCLCYPPMVQFYKMLLAWAVQGILLASIASTAVLLFIVPLLLVFPMPQVSLWEAGVAVLAFLVIALVGGCQSNSNNWSMGVGLSAAMLLALLTSAAPPIALYAYAPSNWMLNWYPLIASCSAFVCFGLCYWLRNKLILRQLRPE